MPSDDELRHRRYGRATPEFGRVSTLSDGVFAIAMTLLVFTLDASAVSLDRVRCGPVPGVFCTLGPVVPSPLRRSGALWSGSRGVLHPIRRVAGEGPPGATIPPAARSGG